MNSTQTLHRILTDPANYWETVPLVMYADSLENPDSPYARAVSGLQEHTPQVRTEYRHLIADHPDDIPLHLGYAHWLSRSDTEADRDRAEFIRTQLALDAHMQDAHRARPSDDWQTRDRRVQAFNAEHPELKPMLDRTDELLIKNYAAWMESDFGPHYPALSQTRQSDGGMLVNRHACRAVSCLENGLFQPNGFDKGQVSSFSVNSRDPAHALASPASPLNQPTSAQIRLRLYLPPQAKDLAKLPQLENARSLSIYLIDRHDGVIPGELLRTVLTNPHLKNLRSLSVYGSSMNVAAAIAQSPNLCNLDKLECYGAYTSADVLAIGSAPHLGGLEKLVMHNSQISGDNIITRTNWQQFKKAPNFTTMELQPDGSIHHSEATHHLNR